MGALSHSYVGSTSVLPDIYIYIYIYVPHQLEFVPHQLEFVHP